MPPENNSRPTSGSSGAALESIVDAIAEGLEEGAELSKGGDKERAHRVAEFFLTLFERNLEAWEAKIAENAEWKHGLEEYFAAQKPAAPSKPGVAHPVGPPSAPRPGAAASAKPAPAPGRGAAQASPAPRPAPRAGARPAPAVAPARPVPMPGPRRRAAAEPPPLDEPLEAPEPPPRLDPAVERRQALDARRERLEGLYRDAGYPHEVAARRAAKHAGTQAARGQEARWAPQRADTPDLGAWWDRAHARAAKLDAGEAERTARLRRGRPTDDPALVSRDEILTRLMADPEHPIGARVRQMHQQAQLAEAAHGEAARQMRAHGANRPPVRQIGARISWGMQARRLQQHERLAEEHKIAAQRQNAEVRAILAADPKVQAIIGGAAGLHVEAAHQAYSQDVRMQNEAHDLRGAMETSAPRPLRPEQLDANRVSPGPKAGPQAAPTPGPRMR